jgi:hypothetical protein
MIIGICGPKETGKDTTAVGMMPFFDLRKIETNITWFADPLYKMVWILTGVPVHLLRDQRYKNVVWTEATAPIPSLIGTSPRELLKDLGMWVRDEIHADHWAQHLLVRTRKEQPDSSWLVPDLRFVNEVKVCDLVIEVRREGVEYAGDHPSEMRLPAELIDETVWLTKGMDYAALAQLILDLPRRASAS